MRRNHKTWVALLAAAIYSASAIDNTVTYYFLEFQENTLKPIKMHILKHSSSLLYHLPNHYLRSQKTKLDYFLNKKCHHYEYLQYISKFS
mgnify:CR=1 FL=1